MQFKRTRSQYTTVSTTQLLMSLYVCGAGDGAPAVCAEFLGPEIGTGWEYRGKCVLWQQGYSDWDINKRLLPLTLYSNVNR